MRNLIIFIRRYFTFFLFLVLEIISLSLVFSYNDYQGAAFLNSSNRVSGYLYSKMNIFKSYLHLQAVNDSLNVQNTRLLNRLSSSFSAPDTTVENRIDSVQNRQFKYYPARVVNNSVGQSLNSITIHRGSLQGIVPGMGVIGPSGVVGIVRRVSENYAVIMPLINRQTKVSAILTRSNEFGSVIWDEQPPNPQVGSLIDISKSTLVYKGDTVVTSGFSTIFPRGLVIGYIEKIEREQTSNFYNLTLRFATNFQSLQYVYVIENLNADEQKELEAIGDE